MFWKIFLQKPLIRMMSFTTQNLSGKLVTRKVQKYFSVNLICECEEKNFTSNRHNRIRVIVNLYETSY